MQRDNGDPFLATHRLDDTLTPATHASETYCPQPQIVDKSVHGSLEVISAYYFYSGAEDETGSFSENAPTLQASLQSLPFCGHWWAVDLTLKSPNSRALPFPS
jgi:hypothetical protein